MLEFDIVDVQISPNVGVQCPATTPRRFLMRKAGKGCPGCKHFGGVYDTFSARPAGTDIPVGVPWEKRYQICCTHPISRRCFDLEVYEE